MKRSIDGIALGLLLILLAPQCLTKTEVKSDMVITRAGWRTKDSNYEQHREKPPLSKKVDIGKN